MTGAEILVGAAATAGGAATATGAAAAATAGVVTTASAVGIPAAAIAGGATVTSATAATAGLFGAGGAFSFGTTFSTLGTAFSAFSAISGGLQQGDMYDYNAAVANNEAIAARQLADYEAKRHDERTRRLLATQRARLGKSGVLTSEGSPLILLAETAREADIDRQVILASGDRQAVAATSRSALDRQQARNARTAGYINAATSVAKGAGNALRLT